MNLREFRNQKSMKLDDKMIKNNAKLLLELYRKVDFYVSDHINEIDELCFETKRKHLEDIVISVLEIDNTIDSNKIESQLINLDKSLALLKAMDLALYKLSNYPDNGTKLGLRWYCNETYNHVNYI